ncbi:PTS-dependent dihydroxyacetone kinase phosphotransferase subunit DhaM [Arthrobacter gengyunqii]|uniref:Phosphocarrier protein HPr n=1 Tax=Arthrobacter gengyunqii TaxID=2886940 RepID=A0A9X1S6I0_9MICC|nr:dihydroxyacetone kinase phosphoryl donor subunit DhaM [Arthrobacter gengyunqii]MCC3266234.1 PTS-dependent dihydroxyacetone kinase phosphotransferase subunit DhaM [Arthrobacter gengyunqii]MCC3268947.1 PTS-dependent dihydroxyacetone kinase phosphotransferase subunit DhaM [Arthrobacter gengyunqii]UOY96324.1 PTS-dependent dihydroxyacetone kinase phosphotransferase subunit DhaM [Arthrobacter gengyunqii]
MSVGLVIVSHSAKLAEGVRELAEQMARDVKIETAGGTDDGGIGTSLEKISAAIAAADTGDGALLLADLGSAVMTAETAVEFLDDDQRARVRLANAPLVEGTVAAAVAAQSGRTLQAVLQEAESAGGIPGQATPPAGSGTGTDAAAGAGEPDDGADDLDPADDDVHTGSWELINPAGLHARPAAAVAQAMADLDAEVRINGVDAKSVMMLMTLGLGQGQTLTLTARGPDAARAVDMMALEVRNGFGEI